MTASFCDIEFLQFFYFKKVFLQGKKVHIFYRKKVLTNSSSLQQFSAEKVHPTGKIPVLGPYQSLC